MCNSVVYTILEYLFTRKKKKKHFKITGNKIKGQYCVQ